MGTKIIVFFDFEKLEKISEIFWEILANFSKKIEGDKTPNFENFRKFVNKNAIKHQLLGDKTPNILGVPQIILCMLSLYRVIEWGQI